MINTTGRIKVVEPIINVGMIISICLFVCWFKKETKEREMAI